MPTQKPSVLPLLCVFIALVFLAGLAWRFTMMREAVPGLPNSGTPTETQSSLQVFYSNSALDPAVSCEKVFPVERTLKGEAGPAEALQQLLAGPSSAEEKAGYFDALPEGVKLNSITIDGGGIAHADFSDALNHVAGSCRVNTIRLEIESTLKQFSSVLGVVISVDGRTDVLQP